MWVWLVIAAHINRPIIKNKSLKAEVKTTFVRDQTFCTRSAHGTTHGTIYMNRQSPTTLLLDPESHQQVKQALSSSPVLSLFDPSCDTVVSADASSHGLGAVLLQKQPDGELKPVAYISRSLTPTERRYAQIEKESLAFTWACERFSDYLLGLTFHIQTDHKPLVPLFTSKNLDELPLRVQRYRFWLRMMCFDFTMSHVPWKSLLVADALSRVPSTDAVDSDNLLQLETAAYVNSVIQNLPASTHQLERIKQHQQEDEVCQQVANYCQSGWPSKQVMSGAVRLYHPVATELSVENGLLMRGSRIVIPAALRLEMLDKLHTGHQGITKCRERARQSVWWLGLSKQLEGLVKCCSECCKAQTQRSEPLIPSSLPELPWQKVATDLLEWRKHTYLLIVDYFSRFIEIARLNRTTAEEVIPHIPRVFSQGTEFLRLRSVTMDHNTHQMNSLNLHRNSNLSTSLAVLCIPNVMERLSGK